MLMDECSRMTTFKCNIPEDLSANKNSDIASSNKVEKTIINRCVLQIRMGKSGGPERNHSRQ